MIDFTEVNAEGDRIRERLNAILCLSLEQSDALPVYEQAIGGTGMELYRTVEFFGQESDRCRSAGCWFTASLMCASAIEGMLCIFCLLSESQVTATSTYCRLEGDTYEAKALRASFDKLIDVANSLDWVPSHALSPEILAVAIEDYPLFAANMYASFEEHRRKKRAADFEREPGIEMLRILQDLRNLVHPSRWPRLKVEVKGNGFESDCKFCYLLSFEVLKSLLTACAQRAHSACDKLTQLYSKFSPEMQVDMDKALSALIAGKEH